ncbi:MAG: hypothetical protein GY932_11065 [Arcobacter sp.]|nr:hypothetical protein [Arcobacter sp.]
MKEKIIAEDFIKILKGEFYNSTHEYSKFYKESPDSEPRVYINNVHIMDNVNLTDEFAYPMTINIGNSVFQGDFWVRNALIKVLMLNHCNFRKSLFFYDCEISNLNIIEVQVSYQLCFRSIICSDRLFIFGEKKFFLILDNSELNHVSISCQKIEGIAITGDKTLINRLIIGNKVRDTKINISNVIINNLFFSGVYNEANLIEIINTKLHCIYFNDFYNSGKMIWRNIKILNRSKKISNITLTEFFDKKDVTEKDKSELLNKNKKIENYQNELLKNISKLSFNNIVLGNTEFKNVELELFESITIIDTELTTVKLFNSTLPTRNVKGNQNSLYEIFNDLYSVAKKQNNKRDEVEYYRASQDSLLKSLLSKGWYKNVPSIISLFVSYLYSNFGTRWIQSFFWILFFGALFFLFMNLSTTYDIDLSLKEESINTFKNLTAYYIQYLNPTHKISFMDNYNSNISRSTWFVFFDYSGRILISIGIFELIRSFRKYVRK